MSPETQENLFNISSHFTKEDLEPKEQNTQNLWLLASEEADSTKKYLKQVDLYENYQDFNTTQIFIRQYQQSSSVKEVEQWNDISINKNKLSIYYKSWDVLNNYFQNPMSSLLSSKTMLLPHQVQAAITILQRSKPRFLIADEVGLGKTIETGLILKECLLKYAFERVLICTPASILAQWQSELKEKFNEEFIILTGELLKKKKLLEYKKIIVSIDLIKDPRYRQYFILDSKYISFDCIIFDEAHRLRRDELQITKAYSFADFVIKNCLNPSGFSCHTR